jgi:hypothetical protein
MYQNYMSAPHFAEHKQFFEELYAREWSKLVDLNLTIIRYLTTQLGLKTQLVLASELGVYERGSTTVLLRICRLVGAAEYLSGKYGRQYLDEALFDQHNVQVRYQDFQHPVYPQLWGDFVPSMSAVDLLFNCGDASLGIIAQANSPAAGTQEELVNATG